MAGKKEKRELSDAERHKRFVEMAHEVGADESAEAFDRAFDKVTKAKPDKREPKPPR